jgi:hypothetical protein
MGTRFCAWTAWGKVRRFRLPPLRIPSLRIAPLRIPPPSDCAERSSAFPVAELCSAQSGKMLTDLDARRRDTSRMHGMAGVVGVGYGAALEDPNRASIKLRHEALFGGQTP